MPLLALALSRIDDLPPLTAFTAVDILYDEMIARLDCYPDYIPAELY